MRFEGPGSKALPTCVSISVLRNAVPSQGIYPQLHLVTRWASHVFLGKKDFSRFQGLADQASIGSGCQAWRCWQGKEVTCERCSGRHPRWIRSHSSYGSLPREGNLEIIELLLDHGADAGQTSGSGKAAMFYARDRLSRELLSETDNTERKVQ